MGKNVKEIENVVDKEEALSRLDAKIKEIQSEKREEDRPWINFNEVKILIDEMFEFNKNGYLDDSNLIKKSSSWQAHRDVFDNNSDFKPSDGRRRETGENKGRKYHVEYFRAIVKYRFSRLKDHYLDKSMVQYNIGDGTIMKLSKLENELKASIAHNYETVMNEWRLEAVWQFAQKHMDLEQLEKDLHQKIVKEPEDIDKKVLNRLKSIDYHK